MEFALMVGHGREVRSRGIDGVADVFRGMFGAHEQSFELAARHVDVLIHEPPKICREPFAIGSVSRRPVRHRVVVEEQGHHASHSL